MLHPLTSGAADKNQALFFVNGIHCFCCAENEPTSMVWLKRQHIVSDSYLKHYIISIQKNNPTYSLERWVFISGLLMKDSPHYLSFL